MNFDGSELSRSTFIKIKKKEEMLCVTFRNPSLQAQHQTRVTPLWWRSGGAPARLPQSHYPLSPGRGVQTKALPTARRRVSTLMMLQRNVPTEGKRLLQTRLKESFVLLV